MSAAAESGANGAMRGKRVVVTGATTGLGRVTARELARLGADVAIVARDAKKADETLGELRALGAGDARAFLADLSLMASVRKLAEELRGAFDRVDVLVNNAGAIVGKRAVTGEGLEQTFALNHLGYFLLTNLLLDKIGSRIVNVSSEAHRGARIDWDDLQCERRYTPFLAYCNSKLMNLWFTFELARRLQSRGITVNAAHPGGVASGFGNTSGWLGLVMPIARPFMLSPEQGARTQIWLASSHDVDGVTGKYFAKCREKAPRRFALDEESQKRLWDVSVKLTGLTA